MTLTALAKHFGVATPSLYTHVRSGADVRTRVALLALDETADLVADALAGVSGRAALAAVGGVWRGYARRHPGRYAATRLPLDAVDRRRQRRPAPRRAVARRAARLRPVRATTRPTPSACSAPPSTATPRSTRPAPSATARRPRPTSDDTWERVLDGLDTLLRSWETR